MWLIKHSIKKKIIRQFVKFCLIGVINTLIDYAFFYLFYITFVWQPFLANSLSVIIAMSFSFVFNKYWTFRNHEKKLKIQYLKFALVNLIYFLLYSFIFFIGVKYLSINAFAAKLIAVIVGLFWNFAANRYWTFKVVK